MQGLGRPIVSFESHGYRMVAIGSELRWSKSWRTFTDFLFDYIKLVVGPEWGTAELAKPKELSHPLLGWYRKVCEFQRTHAASNKKGEIYSGIATGAVRAYLGLAYDLYLCAHNADFPVRLLKRLRHPDQFEGALYEAFVIGCFAKAGFAIEFEDESDSSVSHCEFTATHKETARKFSVEAKSVTLASKRSGKSTEPPKIRGYLFDALRKKAAHPRIVFIELSRAHANSADGAPEWAPHVVGQIERAENDIKINEQPAPSAYVFITNRPFVHDLDGTALGEIYAASGFKIDDFPAGRNTRSILDMHKARERHLEIHWLLKALDTHRQIPTTFDDRLPEEIVGDQPEARLLIGGAYIVPDSDGKEVQGTLEDAVVMEPENRAYGTYKLGDGRRILCTTPLTETELVAYRRSPETFFGVMKQISKGIKHPLDAFDFLYATYSKSSREKLLEFMADAADIDALRALDQRELAEQYCARLATKMWADISDGKTNLTHERH